MKIMPKLFTMYSSMALLATVAAPTLANAETNQSNDSNASVGLVYEELPPEEQKPTEQQAQDGQMVITYVDENNSEISAPENVIGKIGTKFSDEELTKFIKDRMTKEFNSNNYSLNEIKSGDTVLLSIPDKASEAQIDKLIKENATKLADALVYSEQGTNLTFKYHKLAKGEAPVVQAPEEKTPEQVAQEKAQAQAQAQKQADAQAKQDHGAQVMKTGLKQNAPIIGAVALALGAVTIFAYMKKKETN